jgi:hypothetical protein
MTKKRPHPVPLETSHPTTDSREAPGTVFHDYFHIYSMANKPANNRFIDSVARELIEWSTTDDALKIEQFWIMKGISLKTVKKWKTLNENFARAHQHALLAVGTRREVGAIRNRLNAPIIASSMPMYDKKWKKLAEWRASLRNKEEQQDTIRVVVEEVPSSPMVPEKKNERS